MSVSPGFKKPPRIRISYSCETCRDRKVKCDRGRPACNKCKANGTASSCVYRVKDATKPYGYVWVDGSTLQNSESPNSATDEPIPTFGRNSIRVNMAPERLQNNFSLCSGRDFCTRYYSRSHQIGFMSEFSGLKDFTAACTFSYPEIRNLRRQFEVVTNYHRHAKQRDIIALMPHLVEDDYLVTLLPDPAAQQSLVLAYMSRFETMYRVLHIPEFLARLNEFRISREIYDPIIIAQLLLVCTIASGAASQKSEAEEYTGESTPARDEAFRIIRFVDTWLKVHYPKRPSLPILQTKCLLIMARKMFLVDAEQIWSYTSEVVMLAKSMGLHRDPKIWQKVTPYAAEMRRRLWTTIVELHILFSLERGMAPVVASAECDCDLPANLDDNELKPDMEELPPSKPASVFTSSSVQIMLGKSQALRLRLVHRLNGLRWDMSRKEATDLEQSIMHARSTFLDEAEVLNYSELDLEGMKFYPCRYTAIIQLYLRQFSLLILQPFTVVKDIQPEAHERRTCLEISIAIIEQSCEYLSKGDMILPFAPLSMIARAAFYICQELIRSVSAAPVNSFIIVQRTYTITAALDVLKRQSYCTGRGLRDFALVNVALGFVQNRALAANCLPPEFPQTEADIKVATVKRAVEVCQRLLDRQRPQSIAMATNGNGSGVTGSFKDEAQTPASANVNANNQFAVQPQPYDMGGEEVEAASGLAGLWNAHHHNTSNNLFATGFGLGEGTMPQQFDLGFLDDWMPDASWGLDDISSLGLNPVQM